MSSLRFVIDGTNVLLLHGTANPELRYVLALCRYLRNEEFPFICFFDANTSYLLEERSPEQHAVFLSIIRDQHWSAYFHVVPGGTEADEWILRRAKADGADVISNDKYRGHARKHRWIWKRRHPLVGTRDRIILKSLGLELPVLSTACAYV